MNNFDQNLMLVLNFDGAPWLDAIMQFASAKLTWLPLYALLIFLMFRWLGWKRAVLAVVFVAVGVVAADQICNLFKNNWNVPRPTHSDIAAQLHNVVRLGSQWGTASAHAATTFFIFTFVWLVCRRRWLTYTLLGWTLLVSYSRIYLGLHFPFQIVLGICVGALLGIGLYYLYRLFPEKK